MKSGQHYTEAEDKRIKRMRAKGASLIAIAEALGRTPDGIRRRAAKIGARLAGVKNQSPGDIMTSAGVDKSVPGKGGCPMAPSLERAGIWYEDVKLKKVARRRDE